MPADRDKTFAIKQVDEAWQSQYLLQNVLIELEVACKQRWTEMLLT